MPTIRNQSETDTSRTIGAWVAARRLPIRATRLFRQYQVTLAEAASPPTKANLGEFAIQEVMNPFALQQSPRTGVLLFEDHKIARAGLMLPENAGSSCMRAISLDCGFRRNSPLAARTAAIRAASGRSYNAVIRRFQGEARRPIIPLSLVSRIPPHRIRATLGIADTPQTLHLYRVAEIAISRSSS